jgi:hypothetical protein
MNPDLDRLRAVARKEPAIGALLDLLRRGRVRGNHTVLRPLAARFGDDTGDSTRLQTLITACRLLENCGMGQLLQPTRAHRARFVWAVHPHVLRDGLASDAIVTLELPADLTEHEAKRLGHFLLAIATGK